MAVKNELGRSFAWLNVSQFLGALNDNVFKLLLIMFLIKTQPHVGASQVTAIAGAVFVVPFLLFSAYAGKLSDRFSKRNIILWVKIAEVVIMVVGFAALMSGNTFFLYAVLFVMAGQSAFFGPAKYGIVPEIVTSEQISRANGLLEALTYLAIIIGTAIVPLISQVTGDRYGAVGLLCVLVAIAGVFTGLRIQKTPAGGGRESSSLLFVRDIWRTLMGIRNNKDLFLAVIASAYFLLIGGFIYSNLIPYGMRHLDLNEAQSGYLFLMVAIGIGLGSLWAGKLSGRTVEFGIVPLGAVGLTLSSLGLGLLPGGLYLTLVFILIMGISAGLFIVPIHAFIQLRSPSDRRGEVLAASNFLGWVGVLISSGLIYAFSAVWKMSAAQMFATLGVITLVPTIVTIIILPDFLVRFLLVMLTKFCYRMKVKGLENIPTEGSVLLVSNHVSWVDALLLCAPQQRRIRFVVFRDIYNKPWLKPIFKLMKVIPISSEDPPKKIISSIKEARKAMEDGFIVCIFAEGALTRNGMLGEFKSGFERIMKNTHYDIIPTYIGGAWGSIFSYYYGKLLATMPKKFPYPVSVHFGEPLPAESSAGQIRQKVQELSSEYYNDKKCSTRSLPYDFVSAARRHWTRKCISDTSGKELSYGKTLTSAVALKQELERTTDGQDKVGILLPPSVAAVVTNLSVSMLSKVPVNLNYTLSPKECDWAIQQCGIKTVITSRKFLDKAGMSDGIPGLVYIEDIMGNIKTSDRVRAFFKAVFVPRRILSNSRGSLPDDLATVIFSSGSSGKPKGIMLSHHNILSNIEAVRLVIHLRPDDNVCAVLPFFHSFGFTCALWLPLVSGVSSSYVDNPLDGRLVGKTARENSSTILFAPPTFLLSYVRRAQREDFAMLRIAAAGAEKLKRRLADSFEKKFGIEPLEGYGATELSPVVSLNVPNVEAGGMYQIGHKPDTVGHPLPGVAVKIVDLESNERLSVGKTGMIMVKGPNVMLGYLNDDEQTQQVLTDGWYETGDIGYIDVNGFLTITDRLSRFSKIGGEMVPHIGVEEVYLNGLNTDEQVVAITSVPEPKKGEELILLYLEKAGDADSLHEIISRSDLPNMWKPRRNNYIKIESMPLLGSGKLDILGLRKLAMEARGNN